MPDVTALAIDEMEPIYGGLARRARAELGVTAWGMQVFTRCRQPALAAYMRDASDGVHRAYGVMVLACEGERIAGIVGFADLSLFPAFGLPPEHAG